MVHQPDHPQWPRSLRLFGIGSVPSLRRIAHQMVGVQKPEEVFDILLRGSAGRVRVDLREDSLRGLGGPSRQNLVGGPADLKIFPADRIDDDPCRRTVGGRGTLDEPEILTQRRQYDILLRDRGQFHRPIHGRMAEIGRRNR